jgi:hypothetical protein
MDNKAIMIKTIRCKFSWSKFIDVASNEEYYSKLAPSQWQNVSYSVGTEVIIGIYEDFNKWLISIFHEIVHLIIVFKKKRKK